MIESKTNRQKSERSLERIVMMTLFLTFFVITAFKSSTTLQSASGEGLYKQNCVRCHGADGTKGFLGAKNLKESLLPDADILQRIQNGKKFMPSFKKKFTASELNEILLYVKSLRKD